MIATSVGNPTLIAICIPYIGYSKYTVRTSKAACTPSGGGTPFTGLKLLLVAHLLWLHALKCRTPDTGAGLVPTTYVTLVALLLSPYVTF